jgi:hypothetical protein
LAFKKSSPLINDHYFQQAVSCPLKMYFMAGDGSLFPEKPIFRQRNKLNLRNAAALRFPGVQYTSDPIQLAAMETEGWLRDHQTAICGAVIIHDGLVTRIPILVKDGNRLIIIQIHGKLRKESEKEHFIEISKKRTTAAYLLKAAYRFEVLKRAYQNNNISVEFCFPSASFRSTVESLNRVSFYHNDNKNDKLDDLNRLFSIVDATSGTMRVCESIPELVSHSYFSGRSVAEVVNEISSIQHPVFAENFRRHEGCKWCKYRKMLDTGSGCWETFFKNEAITKPERHVFELAGQGNQLQNKNGMYYQEQVEIEVGPDSFEMMHKYGGQSITIQQRRNLQILQAKGKQTPLLWIKPGIKILNELRFPIHFLDFEAATYALPFKRGARPYEPVYFQFSCHTLNLNGELHHNGWIDLDPEKPDPHLDFVNAISMIPGIYEGTIIQFSPFENQGIKNLINSFRKNSMLFERQLNILENIRLGPNRNYRHRFFDINEFIRSYYYNCFQTEGLGLKQVFESIKKWEKIHGKKYNEDDPDDKIYHQVQEYDSVIHDGSAAMNAWIAMKNGLLSPEELRVIPQVLQKYCFLDSILMFCLFKHVKKYAKIVDGHDLVIFSQSISK